MTCLQSVCPAPKCCTWRCSIPLRLCNSSLRYLGNVVKHKVGFGVALRRRRRTTFKTCSWSRSRSSSVNGSRGVYRRCPTWRLFCFWKVSAGLAGCPLPCDVEPAPHKPLNIRWNQSIDALTTVTTWSENISFADMCDSNYSTLCIMNFPSATLWITRNVCSVLFTFIPIRCLITRGFGIYPFGGVKILPTYNFHCNLEKTTRNQVFSVFF